MLSAVSKILKFESNSQQAFHEMNEGAFKIYDEKGTVVSYQDYRSAVKSIDNKYNETYLQTEYNLFTNSALAADKWKEHILDVETVIG